jgi:hypothetical protein
MQYSQQDLTVFIWYTDNDSYLTMLYFFTFKESPIVESAGFESFYLIYWQCFIFNHVVYCFTCTEAPVVQSEGFDIFYLIYWQWFIFNHVVFFFTCTELPIVQSAGFDIFYLIYWQWFIFNHVVYFFLYRGTCSTVSRMWHFLFDILTMIHI